MAVFAIIDGNNFYASCERVFNPKLKDKPIVVLSNNDGCVIARSNEAKAFDIKMGAPYHEMKELIKTHDVKVFSSNYTLYGDMSARMMQTLSLFSPDMEVYSIDECFLGLKGYQNFDLTEYAHTIRTTVKQHIGIPTSIGIAATKTLAKIANRYAKNNIGNNGVMTIEDENIRRKVLEETKVDDIWGIGRRYCQKLIDEKIYNALELSKVRTQWAKANLGGVVGERLIRELNGDSCIELQMIMEPKKNIAATRAFGKIVTEENELREAISHHIFRASEKLRAQNSVAKIVTFFFHSNPFSKVYPYFRAQRSIELPVATNDPRKMIDAIRRVFGKEFKKGIRYHKCGIILQELSPAINMQFNLFSKPDSPNSKALWTTVDDLNKKFGSGMLRLASSGINTNWQTQANLKTPCYTTKWKDLLKVIT